MVNLQADGPRISGSFHPATKEGASAVLLEANNALLSGYDFVGLEKIEGGTVLFVIYRKRVRKTERGEAQLTGD